MVATAMVSRPEGDGTGYRVENESEALSGTFFANIVHRLNRIAHGLSRPGL